MSGRVVGWAAEQVTGSPVSKLVLFKLADNANDDGTCWPSIALLAEHTELGERTVQEHLKRLEARGLIKIERKTSGGVNLPNVYHLAVNPPARRGKVVQEPHHGDGAGAAPGVQLATGDGAPRAGGVVQETARHIEEPSFEPSKNLHSFAPDGASENVTQLGEGEPHRFEEFRSAIADTWPGAFPARDEGKCRSVFVRVTRTVKADLLIACAKAHGAALADAKARRSAALGAMAVKLPSNWLGENGFEGYSRVAEEAAVRESQQTRALARVQSALGPRLMEILRHRLRMSDPAIAALDGVTFEPGPPPVLVGSGVQRLLLERHTFALQRALGEELTFVTASSQRRAG